MSKQRAAARSPLTRELVLSAAVPLADLGGIDALSMRKLGHELGVEAMSLYNHVASKQDLLDGIIDRVVGEIDDPVRGGDWKTTMRRSAISAHHVLRRHPWACGLWTRSAPGTARLRYMESVFACLHDGGFGIELTYHAYHVLDIYVVGFTSQQMSYQSMAEDLGLVAANFLAELSMDDYPFVSAHARQHFDGTAHDDDFEFGLDLILDGLGRLLDVR